MTTFYDIHGNAETLYLGTHILWLDEAPQKN